MILCFELSMPRVNTWNGRWTGEKNYYAKVRNMGRSKKADEKSQAILEKRSFRYDFGDGWVACITVTRVTQREAAKARRKSCGFYGYDWMVESIINHGLIKYTE